ncbi:hypothetical protein [Rhodomicrobium sp. R_RK_3]|nr:hypothetical protein [Rhodomicrobium sp. R_RK_3]
MTASLLKSTSQFWAERKRKALEGVLRGPNLRYNKWLRWKQAERISQLALAHHRCNELEQALSTLEAGLDEHPDSQRLLADYLRICCDREQLARVLDFIDPAKTQLRETLAAIRILTAPPDRNERHLKNAPVRLTAETVDRNFAGDVVKLWRLADLMEHAGKVDISSQIHRQLSRRAPVDLDDYVYGGVSDIRLGQVESGFKKLSLGLAAFPESEHLKSVLKDCCYAQLAFDHYLSVTGIMRETEPDKPDFVLDFYRNALRLNKPEAFMVKFKDAEINCGGAAFPVLQDEFLAALRDSSPSLEQAKRWIFLSRLLGLEAQFTAKLFLLLYSLDWGQQDQSAKYLLTLIYKLTLVLAPHHEFDPDHAVSQFANDAQAFARQPMSMSEPIADFGPYWAIWTSLLFIVQPRRHGQTMAAFEQLAFKLWPRLDYTAPHIRRRISLRRIARSKIRVGFTVLDSMPMMSGLMDRLDKRRFETVFLRAGPSGQSPTANEWIARSGKTVEYSDRDAYAAIATIAKQKLDMLISGPCVPQIFFPLMARLAHLHMVLLEPNWPDGIKNSDYYISWQLAEPENYRDFYKTPVSLLQRPPYWIEKTPLRDPSASAGEAGRDIRRRLLGLTPDERVYVCANTTPKIHPQMDEILLKLLETDPGGRLVFLRGDQSPAQLLKARLREKLGRHYERVIFVNSLEKDDAHALLLAADCCIDSFPICGMSSSFDGIMLGVPIVTLPADIPFGRWTAAIYQYLGITGLTAGGADDYIAIAVKLATDKDWRRAKSAELTEKASLYIENQAGFDEFQHFLLQAWRRKQAGLPPTSWVAGEWQGG